MHVFSPRATIYGSWASSKAVALARGCIGASVAAVVLLVPVAAGTRPVAGQEGEDARLC